VANIVRGQFTRSNDTAAAYQQHQEALQELWSSVTSWTVKRADVTPYLGTYDKGWRVDYPHHDHMLWLTRRSGYRSVLLPTAAGYLIGSGNESSGLGTLVTFARDDDGTMRMTLTKEGAVIDSLAQLRTPK
jgi:hypothetical protein